MKERTADEMFEELGYSILDGIENFYTNVLIAGKKQKDISFDDIAKDFITISLTKYNEYGNLETNQIVLSVKELQAINKKVEELRVDIEEYIKNQLDISGGACWSINTLGLAQVDYCFNEYKFKIFWVNVKLFTLWILRKY